MAHVPSGKLTHDAPEARHEDHDVDVRAILGFGVGLIVAAIAINFLVWLLFGYFDAREVARVDRAYPLAAGQDSRQPPEPRLQTNPRGDLSALRAREDEILTHYRWVDKANGVVRIPIDEAMKLTVQRGLPTRPTGGETK